MTPNDIQNEMFDELSTHDVGTEAIAQHLMAHKARRDAALDAATSTMSIRVQRARNAESTGRTRPVVRFAYALGAAAVAVTMVVTFQPYDRDGAIRIDTVAVAERLPQRADNDVDALAEELTQRNGNGSETWTVTDADVDRLLGEADIEL
ncbi:MAG TPA: hypothetical protein DCZ59_10605 [Bacteroidetes bacterium]|nr:hypothetical protein [Bacteroidota bacterium]